MNRRSVVRYCGLVVVGGATGCIDTAPEIGSEGPDDGASGEDSDDTKPDDEGSDDTKPDDEGSDDDESDDEKSDAERAEIETTFEVRSVECGSGEDHAEISTENQTVIVDGVIGGKNGCYSADLAATSIEDDRLRIEVESNEDTDSELCTQCLTDVTYEAMITIDSERPSRIIVEHDGSNVMSDDFR